MINAEKQTKDIASLIRTEKEKKGESKKQAKVERDSNAAKKIEREVKELEESKKEENDYMRQELRDIEE